jgi:hypothetical protein
MDNNQLPAMFLGKPGIIARYGAWVYKPVLE